MDEVSEIAGECHRDSGDGAGLIHDERAPSVEEGQPVAVQDAEEHILSPRFSDLARDLRIRQRPGQREEPGQDPDADHDAGDLHHRRNALGRQEYPRPDDRADHDCRGGIRAEPARECLRRLHGQTP